MTKLKVINRAACNLLCETIEENLAEIATKLGVRIRVGSGSFDSGQVTFKIECALIANGEVQSKEATDFKTYASRYGLKAEDLGREFTDFSGKRFKIVGCKPRSHIYLLA